MTAEKFFEKQSGYLGSCDNYGKCSQVALLSTSGAPHINTFFVPKSTVYLLSISKTKPSAR